MSWKMVACLVMGAGVVGSEVALVAFLYHRFNSVIAAQSLAWPSATRARTVLKVYPRHKRAMQHVGNSRAARHPRCRVARSDHHGPNSPDELGTAARSPDEAARGCSSPPGSHPSGSRGSSEVRLLVPHVVKMSCLPSGSRSFAAATCLHNAARSRLNCRSVNCRNSTSTRAGLCRLPVSSVAQAACLIWDPCTGYRSHPLPLLTDMRRRQYMNCRAVGLAICTDGESQGFPRRSRMNSRAQRRP